MMTMIMMIFFQSRKAQQPACWECQMPDFSIEHAPHPSVEPIGLLGPYWVKGTLTWEDHEWILKETGCSASIRKVRDSQRPKAPPGHRQLTVTGPVMSLWQAYEYALLSVECHGHSGGRKSKAEQEALQERKKKQKLSEDNPDAGETKKKSSEWEAPPQEDVWTWADLCRKCHIGQ